MATRSERDRQKATQEKYQMILNSLLKDDDNKYCVDCDAKGPRWASWNIGIFLCIRCAGIHRNLGVHISKVKSVNLDTWTQDQVAMMQEMGNSRARAVYEAKLDDNYRRPTTDSGLEAFIRAKYELKKYIADEWIPVRPKFQLPAEDIGLPSQPKHRGKMPVFEEMPSKDKKKKEPKPVSVNPPPGTSRPVSSQPELKPVTAPAQKPEPAVAAIDLLGLDEPPAAQTNTNDIFGDFFGAPAPAVPSNNPAPSNGEVPAPSGSAGGMVGGGENLLGGDAPAPDLTADTQDATKKSNQSILALYGSSQQQQPSMYGVPGGMYMQPNMGMPTQAMYPGGMAQQQSMMMNQGQPRPYSTPNMAQFNPAMVYMGMPGMMMMPPQGQMNMGGMGMMGGAPSMGGVSGMGGMPGYSQSQGMNQLQNQMGSMSLGGMPAYPTPVAAGGMWATQPSSGHTLSNNLWQ